MRLAHTLFILPTLKICNISHCRNGFAVYFVTQILPPKKEGVCLYAHFNASANIYPSICLRCCTIITANEKFCGGKKRTRNAIPMRAKERAQREKSKIQYRRSYFSIKSSWYFSAKMMLMHCKSSITILIQHPFHVIVRT